MILASRYLKCLGLFPFGRQLITHCLKVIDIPPFHMPHGVILEENISIYARKLFKIWKETINTRVFSTFHCLKILLLHLLSKVLQFHILLLQLLLLKSGPVKESSLLSNSFFYQIISPQRVFLFVLCKSCHLALKHTLYFFYIIAPLKYTETFGRFFSFCKPLNSRSNKRTFHFVLS